MRSIFERGGRGWRSRRETSAPRLHPQAKQAAAGSRKFFKLDYMLNQYAIGYQYGRFKAVD